MRARTLTRVCLATLAVCALTAAPAAARLVRPVSSFTPTGVSGPTGVAVDQATGDVYVTGNGSENVEKFSASGVREMSFVSPALAAPTGVAVDDSGGASRGDVYVADGGLEAVLKLDSSGKEVAGFPSITASSIPPGDPGSEAFSPGSVAVDPSNGNVVVADYNHQEVDIFSSAGAFISQFGPTFAGLHGVAVGTGGEIFTSSEEGTQEWSPADKYATPTQIGPSESGWAIATDLATGNVLVNESQESRHIDEYEASGAHALLLQFGLGLLGGSSGVAVNEATDTVYASAPISRSVEVFGAPEELPEVLTGSPATGVTGTAADVSGTVNPGGVPVTGCRFEYGLSVSYGASVPCSPAPPLTGSTGIPVAASLSVQPDETYHYRLVAVNANGAEYGEDETVQTEALAPTLQSESVSALRQTSATLDASINPNDQETTYHFEYGTTTAYGTVLPVPDASIGSGYGAVHIGEELSGLQPGTTYHFRVIASNATSPAGGTVGPDQTFTTPPLQPPVVSTGQAQGVAQNTATLTGTVDTQGFQTWYEFDIGTDTGYGTRIFGDAGTEPGAHTFTVALQGLAPGTAYHYRVAATNTFGTVYGVDVTFTTSIYPSAALSVPVSAAFVPALLLAPAARHGRARKSSGKRPGGHRRKGRSRGAGHAHGVNRGGGRR